MGTGIRLLYVRRELWGGGAAVGDFLAGQLAKVPPPVAIGWGALTLFLVLLFAFVALAPSTVVSILPGASRLYSGSPSLDLQDVQFSWDATNIESPVMMVEGQIVN